MVDTHQWDVQIVLNCEEFIEFEECINWGCYWYDGECHNEPPVCEELIDQADCELNNCYWYNDSCHSEPSPPPPDIFKYILVLAGISMFAIGGYIIMKRR